MFDTRVNRAKLRRSFGHILRTCLGAAAVLSIAVGFEATSGGNNTVTARNSISPHPTRGATESDDASKAKILHDVLSKFASGEKPDPALLKEFVSIQNAHVQTGPKIGEKVPDFTLPDQDAQKHTLHELMGANGLLLVFVRSADW